MKTIYHPGYRRLVDRLRQARISRGLTQRDVAEQVGRKRAWLGKIEQCELKLDVVGLVRVARACGLKGSTLVEELEEELPLWWLFFYVSGVDGVATFDAWL